jgi:hypothetical protein
MRLSTSSRLLFRLPTCKNLRSTEQIFIKFYIGEFDQNLSFFAHLVKTGQQQTLCTKIGMRFSPQKWLGGAYPHGKSPTTAQPRDQVLCDDIITQPDKSCTSCPRRDHLTQTTLTSDGANRKSEQSNCGERARIVMLCARYVSQTRQ